MVDCKAGLVEDTDSFTKIFSNIYNQYQWGQTTDQTDQVSVI